MPNTSYVKAVTSEFDSYSPTGSVLVSASLPDRFYFRGCSVSVGGPNTVNTYVLNVILQDGPGEGGNDGFLRFTSGFGASASIVCSEMMPEDSYVLIENGLYFWAGSASSTNLPISITVFYT